MSLMTPLKFYVFSLASFRLQLEAIDDGEMGT